jgi:hypothetical protein
MKPTILFKGKKYESEEAMPPAVRREYQQAYQDDPELAELEALQREYEAQGGEAAPGAPPGEHLLELLPATCPTCGGPLHGKDVKWTGAQSADYPYCGANLPMRTELGGAASG